MQSFSDSNELIPYAEKFVKDKINRLEDVVNHCLYEIPGKPGLYATFPAIFYCFATIDLLGALYTGNATRNKGQAKKYMKKFMNYTPDQCYLLMNQFRHKIAHLTEPEPVIELKSKYIAWRYEHELSAEHLKIKKLPRKFRGTVTSKLSVECDHEFHICILGLVKDIKTSIEDYLRKLRTTPELQMHFDKAIREIYDYR